MATMTASPPAMSPPLSTAGRQQPQLPPLSTSRSNNRRPSAQRPVSALLNRRVSSYSSTSHSVPPSSRPMSTVFPAFHSSLSYTLVRDFAYPVNHPMHYDPEPEVSAPTPASERRLSDPEPSTWEDGRGSWSATTAWMSEESWSTSKDQLPAKTYNDSGPPYSEDDDLQSPVVTSARHRKKSDRGRSPGDAGTSRGATCHADSHRMEQYRPNDDDDEFDGPGGEIETFTRNPKHRDSNFAKPLHRDQYPVDGNYEPVSEEYDSEDGGRYSKDYSFSIASPDEEMHGKAIALFNFESEHENELPLREGQIILVSYRHGQGWLVAEDPVSGESGLVPEEFVRLARHIEGGLNGLDSVGLDDAESNSPTSNDGGSAATPTDLQAQSSEKQPAVQSNFSTSTRDFSPMPKSSRTERDR